MALPNPFQSTARLLREGSLFVFLLAMSCILSTFSCDCVLVPADLDVRMKATLLGAVFLIVSLTALSLPD